MYIKQKMFRLTLKAFLVILTLSLFFSSNVYSEGLEEYSPGVPIRSVTYDPPKDNVEYAEYFDSWVYGWGYNWRPHFLRYNSRILRQVLFEPEEGDPDNALAFEYQYPAVGILKASLTDDDRETIICEFGHGVFSNTEGAWNRISTTIPNYILTADLNGDDQEAVICVFDHGVFSNIQGAWNRISTTIPNYILTADLNGDGKEALIFEFDHGVFSNIEGTWNRISTTLPNFLMTADLNEEGKEALIFEFDHGVFSNIEGAWNRISTTLPNFLMTADLNGEGKEALIFEFDHGVFSNIEGAWNRISTTLPNFLMTADLNGDGKEALIFEFDHGVFSNIEGTWNRISTTIPNYVLTADLGGDGKEALIFEFDHGVFSHIDGTWNRISTTLPNFLMTADLNGDGKEALIFGFDHGVFSNIEGSWNRISTGLPNTDVVEYAYSDKNFENLIYTAVYDSAGNLIDIEYAALLEYWDEVDGLLKRKTETSGDIYEYLEETYGGQDYGRITLFYDADSEEYRTYDWDEPEAGQVTVNEYSGIYTVDGDDIRYVVPSELSVTYVYDHDGEQVNLDADPESPEYNGWVMREKSVYQPCGQELAVEFYYDSDGRMTDQINYDEDVHYTYTYHGETTLYDVKEVVEISTDAWLKKEWFQNDSDNRLYKQLLESGVAYEFHNDVENNISIKWDVDGSVYGYDTGGEPILWEQYDSGIDGIVDAMKTFDGDYHHYYEWNDGESEWDYVESWNSAEEDWETVPDHDRYDSPSADRPAKPSREIDIFEFYPGTGNIRSFFDSNNSITYVFEDLDFFERASFDDLWEGRGQGRLIRHEYMDDGVVMYNDFTYPGNALSDMSVLLYEYRWNYYGELEKGWIEYYDEDFHSVPYYEETGVYTVIGAPIVNPDTERMNPAVMVYDHEGTRVWSDFITDFCGQWVPAAVSVDGEHLIAATDEWNGDHWEIKLVKYDLDTGVKEEDVLWSDTEDNNDLRLMDIEVLPGGEGYLVLGQYVICYVTNERETWLMHFDTDLNYQSRFEYSYYHSNMGYRIELDGENNRIIRSDVYDDLEDEYYFWYVKIDPEGTILEEAQDKMGARNYFLYHWYGVNHKGRFFQEYIETEDWYEGWRSLSFVENTAADKISLWYDSGMDIMGDFMIAFLYHDPDPLEYVDFAAAGRFFGTEGMVGDVVFMGNLPLIVKAVDVEGNTFWYDWDAGDDLVRVKRDKLGNETVYFFNTEMELFEDLFEEGNWDLQGPYDDEDYDRIEIDELYNFRDQALENPALPDLFYAESGRPEIFTVGGMVYFRKDEPFYDDPEKGRVLAIVGRSDATVSVYSYFDDESDRIAMEGRFEYDMGGDYYYDLTHFYNESFYDPGEIDAYISPESGHGREYLFIYSDGPEQLYGKRLAYFSDSDVPAIEEMVLCETLGVARLFYYYDLLDPDPEEDELQYVRAEFDRRPEFDSWVIGDAELSVDEGGDVVGIVITALNFVGDTMSDYEGHYGNIYYFLWGEDSLEGIDYENLIVAYNADDGEWYAFDGFDSDPGDIDVIMAGIGEDPNFLEDWIYLEDFDPTDLEEQHVLPHWGEWLAANEVLVDFPPLSTWYAEEVDGLIPKRIEYNDMFDVVTYFDWDIPAEEMTADMYFDSTGDGEGDMYVYQIVYDTGGDTDLGNIDEWIIISETYHYTRPASLDEMYPGAGRYIEPSGSFIELMDDITGMGLFYSGAGITGALLDDGIETGGHAAKTSSLMTSLAEDIELLDLNVFSSEYAQATPGLLSSAINYAADLGTSIITMPFTMSLVPSVVSDAIEYATEKGLMLIASAGNDGTDVMASSLAAQKGLVTVGSLDNDGKISEWSNTGEWVDIYAPWEVLGNTEKGTSFSTAYVAGVAALLLEQDPEMTSGELLESLKSIFEPLREGESSKEELESSVDQRIKEAVLTKNDAILKSRQEATGYGPKMDTEKLKILQKF